MTNYSDKIKLEHWIENCPVDNIQVILPDDQLTEDQYRHLLHAILYLQLGARKDEWKFIKAKLQRQLQSIDEW